ncbi:MAG TPA: four helix bundle protein [Ohtaekwangia sp.]|nr:four helix bundle protein [Ohtaekwangia sp.]
MISGLEDFKTYNLAMELGERVWNIVSRWGYFEKDTVGKQFVRAADSVAANLSEGLGRFHYKETKNFSYFSRGSLFETRTWVSKSFKRNLISKEEFENLESAIEIIGKMVNNYINSIGQVNEPFEHPYLTPNTNN